jgi:hypothetical protein
MTSQDLQFNTKCFDPFVNLHFDVDVYDCRCGHLFGDHRYVRAPIANEIQITDCFACQRGDAPKPQENQIWPQGVVVL